VFLRHLHFLICSNNFFIFPYFSKNSVYLQYGNRKTSTSNTFGYIKDKALVSADSIGFSVMADRMMQLWSLSRDQKWPRLPNRHGNDTLNMKTREKKLKMTHATCFRPSALLCIKNN